MSTNTDRAGEGYSLNLELKRKQPLLDLIEREDIGQLLQDFKYDWTTSRCNVDSEIYRYFKDQQWTKGDELTRLGTLVYGRMALHFNFGTNQEKPVIGNYQVTETLGLGKNSAIFLAFHRSLGFLVVLKLIRPGASDDIENSLKKVMASGQRSTIIMPTDIFHVPCLDVLGNQVTVTCLVFPHIDGQPLDDFLREKATI